ncbi:Magnesium transport protein, partial [Frankliniella fusca]
YSKESQSAFVAAIPGAKGPNNYSFDINFVSVCPENVCERRTRSGFSLEFVPDTVFPIRSLEVSLMHETRCLMTTRCLLFIARLVQLRDEDSLQLLL